MVNDFNFYVGGIEDAMLALLEEELRPLGVKTFATYSGELDSDNLKKAISALSPKFPLVMVSYTDGKDVQLPRTAAVLGKSRTFQHECSFAVICAAADSRGDLARRRGAPVGSKKIGVYQMLSAAREILTDMRLKVRVESSPPDTSNLSDSTPLPGGDPAAPTAPEILLTHQPLLPSGTEFIARIPDVTAYAQIFDTYFKYQSLDRSDHGIPVTEFILTVESLNDTALPAQKPGFELV